jgi:HAD superfamily 5'-nucleotidase-like hydrolase
MNENITQKKNRKVFCNRTLNMRSIRAIGYDMDYTLIHYHAEEWEKRTYAYLKEQLLAQGWPIEHLEFDPKMVCRGLIIDTEKGNLVKANRFGLVKYALHGTKPIEFEDQRTIYSRTIVDLADRRWVFLNTLFSLSEGCLYAQLVDLLDRRLIPEVLGYANLYEHVKNVLENAHMEGRLKADIIGNPEKYVDLDEETPLALLDQYYAGKRLLLITNSEWHYTVAMMNYTFDRFLPKGISWKDLFEIIIVGARKPQFFTQFQPFFEVIDSSGSLKPVTGKIQKGSIYLGGSAQQVEKYLGLTGDEILYVGDHMFGDVHVTKNMLRWRTALILRELESDIQAITAFAHEEQSLMDLMAKKEQLEDQLHQLRLQVQRKQLRYGPDSLDAISAIEKSIGDLRAQLETLDRKTAPLAKLAAELNNPTWGLLMRSGNDKSYLAYQVERYADIYTSRVSNFLSSTPFAYLRSLRGAMPHEL